MRLYELITSINLNEGYKEVTKKFSDQGANQDEIIKYVHIFKQLNTENKLSGDEKNIDNWGKKSFEEFKIFVNNKQSEQTKTSVKRSKNVGKSITLFENDDWLIVIPLDHDASCYHGKNTDWCTTKPNQGYFSTYFYKSGITLIYLLQIKTGKKWAISYNDEDENNRMELFDMNDDSIGKEEFLRKTGFDPLSVIQMAKKHTKKIKHGREENKKTDILFLYRQAIDAKKRNPELERLIKIKNNVKIGYQYMKVFKDVDFNFKLKDVITAFTNEAGDLNLGHLPIKELPDNLVVEGRLDLSSSSITKLPNNLKVKRSLYLARTAIKELPEDLQVGGSLDLRNSQITSIPNKIKVGGSIYLGETPIKQLPDNMFVDGSLYLDSTPITKLPENLTVMGDLSLSHVPITQLPNKIKVGGSLELGGSQITNIPPNIKVGKNLGLSDTPIKELPDNFKVNGILYLNYTKITRLPKNLRVIEDLYVGACSKLTHLPDDLWVGGDLHLRYCENLTKLPDGLIVRGELFLGGSGIREEGFEKPSGVKGNVVFHTF